MNVNKLKYFYSEQERGDQSSELLMITFHYQITAEIANRKSFWSSSAINKRQAGSKLNVNN